MLCKATLLLSLAAAVHSHMHLVYPPTLKGPDNPNTQGEPDPLLDYPYGCCGKAPPGPCKGHLGLVGTPEGKSVTTWAAGSKQHFTIAGIGNHYGGSCQTGFSLDQKTFKVATSWEGNCPHRNNGNGPDGQSFDFTVPADLPSGDVVFAWTWVNREQEFNMNCAVVTITGGGGANTTSPSPSYAVSAAAAPSTTSAATAPSPTAQYSMSGCTCSCDAQSCACQCPRPAAKRRAVERRAYALHVDKMQRTRRANAMAFASRPDMLFSDYAGVDCTSVKSSSELKYPNPGPELVPGDGEYPLEPPTGSQCGA